MKDNAKIRKREARLIKQVNRGVRAGDATKLLIIILAFFIIFLVYINLK